MGRGVLLDYLRYSRVSGNEYDLLSSYAIPTAQLQACADSQGVKFQQGDILFVRTGLKVGYDALSTDEKLAWCNKLPATWVGVETSVGTARWLWDNGFSACAGDAPGWESQPFPDPQVSGPMGRYTLHELMLAGWGMPIGRRLLIRQIY